MNMIQYSHIFMSLFFIYCGMALPPAKATPHQNQQKQQPRPLPDIKIENVWQFGPGLFSGGQPEGEAGFKLLADLKIKTIISVDGATPELQLAKKHGMRYVHIPYGYDVIGPDEQLQLVRCMAELPQPIFIHCHHGKHRGPAGAAIMARFGLGWSAEDAANFMKIAGTSPDYAGLYQAARNFSAPTAQKLAEASKKTLPEAVEVADMVEMMVAIDQRFDAIKAWAKSTGEKKGEAAANPLQESIQLRELVRESARLPVCNEKPAEFRRQFSLIESDISQLIDLLKSGEATDNSEKASKKAISTVIATITGRCTACHKAFRDK
jgi:hypothetical protein